MGRPTGIRIFLNSCDGYFERHRHCSLIQNAYYERDGLQVLIIFLFNSIIITSQKLYCLNYRSFDRRSYIEIPGKEIIYASVHCELTKFSQK